jgi:hypothetical protein
VGPLVLNGRNERQDAKDAKEERQGGKDQLQMGHRSASMKEEVA